jgi:RNA polymerase sigma-70 factor, ECF subfamily
VAAPLRRFLAAASAPQSGRKSAATIRSSHAKNGVAAIAAGSHTSRVMPDSQPTPPSDEALMQSYASGDPAAFDLLYGRHKGGVYRYLLRHCGNAGSADELFQDVWMNVIRVRATYTPSAKFTTWLYTLAHNRVIDHWRARGQVNLVSIDDDADTSTRDVVTALPGPVHQQPEARADQRQLGTRLVEALATLPPSQREAFLLQQEGGLSLAEIADLTGVGTETVKSRLRYAVNKLRTELAELREDWQ